MMKNQPDYNVVLCRYSEVALKGKNRWIFEQKIIDRINRLLNRINNLTVKKIRGRILIHHHDYAVFSREVVEEMSESLTRVFGLDNFSFCIRSESTMDSISKIIGLNSNFVIDEAIRNRGTKTLTYRIRVKRSDKKFPLSTKEIEISLAEIIHSKNETFTVNLGEDADISVYCEIHKDESFIFYDKLAGATGLPSGTNPPVLTLLSGGFDSPVAAYMIMKRGVFADFITFHSYPFTPDATVEKIKKLVKVLNRYQGPRRLFACNFLEVQKIICAETCQTFRTIFYRRFMFRLAERIARKNGNKALVTGESVGQVASQTIVNLANIENAVDMLILRPLIGMNKEEILATATKIKTFDISKEQVPDSCTVFSPSNPSTGAPLKKILRWEKKLDVDALVDLAYKSSVVIDVEKNEETPLEEYF